MSLGKLYIGWVWPGWRAALVPVFAPMCEYDDTETGMRGEEVPGTWAFEWLGLIACYFGEDSRPA